MLLSVQNAGMSDCFTPKEYYRLIKQAGFEAIDWNIDHAWKRDDVLENGANAKCIFTQDMKDILAYWADHLDAIRENGLQIGQAHAPFPAHTMPYVSKHPDFLDFSIEIYKKCILFCHQVGCPYLIIHGISRRADSDYPNLIELEQDNQKLYESLIPTLQKTNVTVCMENLLTGSYDHRLVGHCSEPHKAAAFIDSLNEKAGKECFGLCLDVGHLFLLHIDFTHYISVLGHRIKTLHLHDNDGINDCHLAPYTGNVPWANLLQALKSVGYHGTINFETYAQVSRPRLPLELIPEFLRHIAAIGEYFRQQLQE